MCTLDPSYSDILMESLSYMVYTDVRFTIDYCWIAVVPFLSLPIEYCQWACLKMIHLLYLEWGVSLMFFILPYTIMTLETRNRYVGILLLESIFMIWIWGFLMSTLLWYLSAILTLQPYLNSIVQIYDRLLLISWKLHLIHIYVPGL